MDFIAAPFAWILRQLIMITGNYGISIILFALLIKIIMEPFMLKSKRSTMRMQRLTPYMKDLEKKYAGNQQKYQESVSALYKEENINPMSGCLWSLIPFPILLALLSIVRMPMTSLMGLSADQFTLVTDKLVSMGVLEIPEKVGAYFEVQVANLVHQNFEVLKPLSDKLIDINFDFFGINLSATPQWNFFLNPNWREVGEFLPNFLLFIIPVASALFTYLQMKITSSTTEAQQPQPGAPNMNIMTYSMPLMSLIIGYTLPASMSIYWMVGYIWSIPEAYISNKYYGKILDAEDEDRNVRLRKREQELEQKRLDTERLRAEGQTERNKSTSKRKRQLVERAKQEDRAAAQKNEGKEIPPSQVGNRQYARGRAYIPDRFTNPNAEQPNEYWEDEYDSEEDDEFRDDSLDIIDTEDFDSDPEFFDADDAERLDGIDKV